MASTTHREWRSDIGGSRSSIARAASSRCRTKTAPAGSSSTARSITIVRCAPLLEAKGHRFRTVSDTEVILHAYEEFGPACVERLEGMFAFAIYDGVEQYAERRSRQKS